MAHNIEIRKINGVEVASFAENGSKERAWHGLGQVVNEPMFVADALKLCHADYEVKLQPVVALNDKIVHAMENGEMISAEELQSLLIPNKKATMRLDTDKALGITSEAYGIVQNEQAFKFVDMLCSGMDAMRDSKPTIECCGVLGNGERVFVTCKMPNDIILDAHKDDRIETYVVFTTSHDGTGAVRCMVTNIRVVCQNTLNWAMKHNSGRISFRHSSKVMSRMDLLKKENAEFAYKTLGLWKEYENVFKQSLEHLRNIKLSERDLDNIIAEITLADEAKKVFFETRDIYHDDIATRGRNIFIGMKEAMEDGVGQNILDKGTALWAINGITSFYQNEANFKNDEVKFDNLMDGNVYKKVQKAYDMLIAA
jgi:phage/plasmid-like protein (TIGR03299 family)